MGGISWLVPSIITGAVSVLVAVAVYAAGRKQSGVQTALDMHKEFYSASLGEARDKARRFLKYHYARDWSVCDPYTVENPEGLLSGYSEVMRFFHRLAVLVTRKRADLGVIADLFARELGWWYGMAFEPMQVRTGWWTKELVNELADVLRKRSPELFAKGLRDGRQEREFGTVLIRNAQGRLVELPREMGETLDDRPPPASEEGGEPETKCRPRD